MHIVCSTFYHIIGGILILLVGGIAGVIVTIGFTYGKAEDMARQYANKLIWKIKKGELSPEDINYISR